MFMPVPAFWLLTTCTFSLPAGAALALGGSQRGISSVDTDGALRSSRISSSKRRLFFSRIVAQGPADWVAPANTLAKSDRSERIMNMMNPL